MVVRSCQNGGADQTSWPPVFFSNTHLTEAELPELDKAGEVLERDILSSRRSRKESPFPHFP